jgi:hypothetical protein
MPKHFVPNEQIWQGWCRPGKLQFLPSRGGPESGSVSRLRFVYLRRLVDRLQASVDFRVGEHPVWMIGSSDQSPLASHTELVKKSGQAPANTSLFQGFGSDSRSQSPFIHNLARRSTIPDCRRLAARLGPVEPLASHKRGARGVGAWGERPSGPRSPGRARVRSCSPSRRTVGQGDVPVLVVETLRTKHIASPCPRAVALYIPQSEYSA